jgi:hypothetical protein
LPPNPNLHLVAASEENGLYSLVNVTMSSQGQLAFILDEMLMVETVPGSGAFIELGGKARTAVWSPGGSQLAYGLVDLEQQPFFYEQFIWTAETDSISPLSELVSDYPDPPYSVTQLHWTPDGSKLLLFSFIDDRHEPIGPTINYILSVVDLEQQAFSDHEVILSRESVAWLTNDRYILGYDCGDPCTAYRAFDYTGQERWSLDWETGGLVAFSTEGNYMLNAGRYGATSEESEWGDVIPTTLDLINLTTGEVDTVWELTPATPAVYFNPFQHPNVSPDGQYMIFNFGETRASLIDFGVLFLIERNGQEIQLVPNSFFQAWGPDGGVIITDSPERRQTRLLQVDFDGSINIIYAPPENEIILGDNITPGKKGIWSPDGRSFIFATGDWNNQAQHIYLWRPDTGLVVPIFTTISDNIDDFLWTADSKSVYVYTDGFGQITDKLYRYDLN